MRRALLDVNVLLALLDSDHADHVAASRWLDRELEGGWASCPITENGAVRVLSQQRYPSPVAPAVAARLLANAQGGPHHAFWSCSISLLDPEIADWSQLHGSRQVTDAYLLALAVAHDGRLVTFERRLPLSAIHGATSDHFTVL